MSSIHAHDVLNMLINAQKEYTVDSLIETISAAFSENAQFHTCSKNNLTASQLIDIFIQKEKLIANDNGFIINSMKICHHK